MDDKAKAVPKTKSSIPAKSQESQGSSEKEGAQALQEKVVKRVGHHHQYGVSKRYSPNSYLETCSCGAARRVTEVAPHKRRYDYIETGSIVIRYV